MEDGFHFHYVLTSLPLEFEAFKINYPTMKEKWSISDMIAISVQEERIKIVGRELINHGESI